MAHSPSPLPTGHLAAPFINTRHLSNTPPPAAQQQPLSKRDKRRSALENRLREISANFSANRDLHLRNQLNSILRDINYINQANPYENKPLDDRAEDLSLEPASGTLTNVVDRDGRSFLGKYAMHFIHDINDAMEERDASLVSGYSRFEKQVDYLKMEYQFSLDVAEAEERSLKDAAKTRVIATLQAKKKAVQREKELLDTADSSALLYNSYGFTITQPASPGGSLNNRKTRHTRHHRQDPDGLEPVESSKRKRKAPADLDNDSPGPGTRNMLDSRNLIWERGKIFPEPEPNQPVSVDRFFTPKELATHYRSACNSTATSWAQRQAIPANANGHLANGHLRAGAAETDTDGKQRGAREGEAEQEDPLNLIAPAMDRTGSHATRSMRNNALDTLLTLNLVERLNDMHQIYGVAVADAAQVRAKIPVPLPTNKDIEAPLTSSLTAQEQTDDMIVFARLISEESF